MVIGQHIPLNELPDRLDELDRAKVIVPMCPHYDRAEIARLYLTPKGYRSRYFTAATAAAWVTHFRHGMLDVRFALPLAVSILIATPIGAWSSQYIAHGALEAILTAFLLTAAILLQFPRRPTLLHSNSALPLLGIGAGVEVI